MPWLEDLKFPRGYQMGTHKKEMHSSLLNGFSLMKNKWLNRYIGDLLIYSTLIMSI